MALASVRRRHRKLEEISQTQLEENLAAVDAATVDAEPATAAPDAMLNSVDNENRLHGVPFAASPALVLRPMEDMFRVFSEVELMVAFEKATRRPLHAEGLLRDVVRQEEDCADRRCLQA